MHSSSNTAKLGKAQNCCKGKAKAKAAKGLRLRFQISSLTVLQCASHSGRQSQSSKVLKSEVKS